MKHILLVNLNNDFAMAVGPFKTTAESKRWMKGSKIKSLKKCSASTVSLVTPAQASKHVARARSKSA